MSLLAAFCRSWLTPLSHLHKRHIALTPALLGPARMSEGPKPTVGIVIIGDEILKGQVVDTNTHYLCKHLYSLGVKVKRVSVLPDDVNTISEEIRKFSSQYTHVITSGGIGPTHDDLTFESVAAAFREDTFLHPELAEVVKLFFKTDDLSSPKFKLARVPRSTELQYGIDPRTGQRNKYPVVKVKNVFVFPGVPSLLERAFSIVEDQLRIGSHAFHMRELYVSHDEASITDVLNSVAEDFKDRIVMGSYPELYNSYYKVKLTLESENAKHVMEAYDVLQTRLPAGSVVKYEKDPIGKAADHIYGVLDNGILHAEDQPFTENLRSSMQTIDEALNRYSLEEICVGFNGGKDCTALLHMVYAAIKRKYPSNKDLRLKVLYIRRGTPFPELEIFIKNSIDRYNLDVITIYGRIKDALQDMKTAHPEIQAVFMGTRSSDPYSDKLSAFSMTDSDWPQYMRVNPILSWSFSNVWKFLRSFSIPYCSLYDRGYTSLGSMENTHPNPELQLTDEKGIITYKPAYLLGDSQSERAGRN